MWYLCDNPNILIILISYILIKIRLTLPFWSSCCISISCRLDPSSNLLHHLSACSIVFHWEPFISDSLVGSDCVPVQFSPQCSLGEAPQTSLSYSSHLLALSPCLCSHESFLEPQGHSPQCSRRTTHCWDLGILCLRWSLFLESCLSWSPIQTRFLQSFPPILSLLRVPNEMALSFI